jgi:hypothetical protein
VNPIRPPARCRMPAASARCRPAGARSRRAAAATTRSSVGRAAAATTRSPSAALDGSATSRAASSCWRSPGTGSGSPGAGRIPCPVRARAISSANSGLPPEIRCSRSRMGCTRSPRFALSRDGSSPPRAAGRWTAGGGSAPAPSDQDRAGRRRNQGAGPPGSGLARLPGDEPRTPAPWPRAHPATGHRRSRRSPGQTRPARAELPAMRPTPLAGPVEHPRPLLGGAQRPARASAG